MANELTTEDDAKFSAPRLPWHPAIEERFKALGVTKASWKVLVEAVFPAAKTVDAVVMALGYCTVRKLDPFKRPVHIVPMWDSTRRQMVETVWPGISEIRTTAFRTSQYAGCDEVEEGPTLTQTFKGMVGRRDDQKEVERTVSFPEWGRVTVYRILNGVRCKFVGPKIFWLETYGREGNTEVPNAMWCKRSHGQFEKCIEAAALRKAFPEEIGNDYSAEEMEGQVIHAPADVLSVAGPVAPEEEITDAEIIEHSETLAAAQAKPDKKAPGKTKAKPPAESTAPTPEVTVAQPEQSKVEAQQAAPSGPNAPDDEDEVFDEAGWMLDVRVRFNEAKTSGDVDSVHEMFSDTLETLVGMDGRQEYEGYHTAAIERTAASPGSEVSDDPIADHFPGDEYIKPTEPAATAEGLAYVARFRALVAADTQTRNALHKLWTEEGGTIVALKSDGDLAPEWEGVLKKEVEDRWRALPKEAPAAQDDPDGSKAFDQEFRTKVAQIGTVKELNDYSTATLDRRNGFGDKHPLWMEWRQVIVQRRNVLNGIG